MTNFRRRIKFSISLNNSHIPHINSVQHWGYYSEVEVNTMLVAPSSTGYSSLYKCKYEALFILWGLALLPARMGVALPSTSSIEQTRKITVFKYTLLLQRVLNCCLLSPDLKYIGWKLHSSKEHWIISHEFILYINSLKPCLQCIVFSSNEEYLRACSSYTLLVPLKKGDF